MSSNENGFDLQVLTTVTNARRRSSYAFGVILTGAIVVSVLFALTIYSSGQAVVAENSGVAEEIVDAQYMIVATYLVSAVILGIIILVIVASMLQKIKSETKNIQDYLTIRSFGNAILDPIPTEMKDGEKIFELAKRVLPSLTKQEEKYQGEKDIRDGYKLDCYQSSPEPGWLQSSWDYQDVIIGKHFGDELITIEKLDEFIDESFETISSISKRKVIRIFLVGRKYDDERFQELQAYEGEPSLAVALKAIKAVKNANDAVHDRPIRKTNMYVLKENPSKDNKSFFEIIWVDSI